MNSYINIEKNKKASREIFGRTLYALTDMCALLICAIFNFFGAVLSFLGSPAVRLLVRGSVLCICVVLVIGTVGACECGDIGVASAFLRSFGIIGGGAIISALFRLEW